MLCTSYWQPRTPADRPGIMLFSPVMGKKCNTKMCMVYVWKEMNKQVQAYGRKPGTESVRSPAFSPRCWAPRVPADGGSSSAMSASLRPAGLLAAGASISITPLQCMQEASQSVRGIRGDFGSLLVPCRAPWPVCWSHHPVLSSPWGRRAGGAVGWQRLCTGDLSWQNRFFPYVFFYIFLSKNCTGRYCVQRNVPLEKKTCSKGGKVASCFPYTSPNSVFLIYI